LEDFLEDYRENGDYCQMVDSAMVN